MDRCRRQMHDCSRKASDYEKMVKKCHREYETAASELGVSTSDGAGEGGEVTSTAGSSDSVRVQLLRQTQMLPQLLQNVLDHTQTYYRISMQCHRANMIFSTLS